MAPAIKEKIVMPTTQQESPNALIFNNFLNYC